VGEVYATLTGRFAVARAIAFAPSLGNSEAPAASPDPAGVARAYAQANGPVPVPVVPPDRRPFLQSMFTDRGNGALTQTVTNLWTPAGSEARAASERSLILNLFSDPPAAGRKPSGGKI
jgi:hypothetical protein